jgi:hypothetical protein
MIFSIFVIHFFIWFIYEQLSFVDSSKLAVEMPTLYGVKAGENFSKGTKR